MSNARLRIYDDGICGTPRLVSSLCTREMERESIEEALDDCQCHICRHLFSHRFSMHHVRTRMLPMYDIAHVYDSEVVGFSI